MPLGDVRVVHANLPQAINASTKAADVFAGTNANLGPTSLRERAPRQQVQDASGNRFHRILSLRPTCMDLEHTTVPMQIHVA